MQSIDLFLSHIKSGSIGINIIHSFRHGLALVPTINRGRETALPCPLYHSGAAGNDIKRLRAPSSLNQCLVSFNEPRAAIFTKR